jgi:hypothetical protein
LVQKIKQGVNIPTLWFNGDEADIRNELSDTNATRLKTLFGNYKLVVIDEAQKIHNIGNTIKIITDTI